MILILPLIPDPITKSITWDHNKLVPKPAVMGEFQVFQRQFEAFMKKA